MNAASPSKMTGRKVFFIFVGCFSVVIAANLALLFAAIGSWPGLEAKNAYAESLGFDDRQKAQAALNWVADVAYETGDVVLRVRNGAGKPVYFQSLKAVVGMATYDRADQALEFSQFQDSYRGPVALAPGNWQLQIVAIGLEGEKFRQRLSLVVR